MMRGRDGVSNNAVSKNAILSRRSEDLRRRRIDLLLAGDLKLATDQSLYEHNVSDKAEGEQAKSLRHHEAQDNGSRSLKVCGHVSVLTSF